MINITPTQLRKAADIQEQILSLQKELGQLLGGSGPAPVEAAAPQAPRKRKISAAGIARIVVATKARWAKIRAAKGGAKPAQKEKKKMSAKGLANIRAAQKARWAKIQGSVSSAKPAQPKKKFSAAHKAALVAAAKARWAKVKKAGKSRL